MYKPEPFASIPIYHDRRIKLNTIRYVKRERKYKMHPDSFEWLEAALEKQNARRAGETLRSRQLFGEFKVEAKPMDFIKVAGL